MQKLLQEDRFACAGKLISMCLEMGAPLHGGGLPPTLKSRMRRRRAAVDMLSDAKGCGRLRQREVGATACFNGGVVVDVIVRLGLLTGTRCEPTLMLHIADSG